MFLPRSTNIRRFVWQHVAICAGLVDAQAPGNANCRRLVPRRDIA